MKDNNFPSIGKCDSKLHCNKTRKISALHSSKTNVTTISQALKDSK